MEHGGVVKSGFHEAPLKMKTAPSGPSKNKSSTSVISTDYVQCKLYSLYCQPLNGANI